MTDCCDFERCFYCDRALTSRHEHDHFPIPVSLGGTETVACCLSCHDLKDRLRLSHWPIDAYADLMAEWPSIPPYTRLLLGHVMVWSLRAMLEEGPRARSLVASAGSPLTLELATREDGARVLRKRTIPAANPKEAVA